MAYMFKKYINSYIHHPLYHIQLCLGICESDSIFWNIKNVLNFNPLYSYLNHLREEIDIFALFYNS